VSQPDVNRPALQLAGFYDYFDSERVQIIGHVEHAYMKNVSKERRIDIISKLMDCRVPCIIFCRNLEIDEDLIKIAEEKGVPILRSSKTTSAFMAEIIRWLNVELAPRISIHGGLVDVYGEGILITGESGIGKSEAALELIKRGHRLVSDDVVEIKKVSDETLIGTSPDITRHFIEVRGIGIIDVKTLFGVESVKNTQAIDLVIKLEEWSKDKNYDRFGLDEQYIEFLGNQVVCHSIPIRPGRNLAVICESAAVNHRQKKMGYNAAQELYKRVTNKIQKNIDQ
jgi:HPr kinase/phosphorylase